MIVAGVVDTHAALWYLFGDPRLSPRAKQFIDEAADRRHTIQTSPISLAELVYLIEKKCLPESALKDLKAALVNPNHILGEAPFNSEVVEVMRQISRDSVPDMPDRVIAATALYFGVPVISRDGHIQASRIQTIW